MAKTGSCLLLLTAVLSSLKASDWLAVTRHHGKAFLQCSMLSQTLRGGGGGGGREGTFKKVVNLCQFPLLNQDIHFKKTAAHDARENYISALKNVYENIYRRSKEILVL